MKTTILALFAASTLAFAIPASAQMYGDHHDAGATSDQPRHDGGDMHDQSRHDGGDMHDQGQPYGADRRGHYMDRGRYHHRHHQVCVWRHHHRVCYWR